MAGKKHKIHDENHHFPYHHPSFAIVDGFLDPPNLKRRRVAREFSAEDLQNLQVERAAKDAADAKSRSEFEEFRAREQKLVEENARLRRVLSCITDNGYDSLYSFLSELMHTKERGISSTVSKMCISHADDFMDSIRARAPDQAENWAMTSSGRQITEEANNLAEYLCPPWGTNISKVLESFSLGKIMAEAERIAPHLSDLLRRVVKKDKSQGKERKDRDLVLVTVICMLSQTRNERSSEFQTTTCIYLLACGASRSQFNVLNHAGFTLSYTAAVRKIKALGQERLKEIISITTTRAFMIVWDNLNIAFRVGEQRKASKDHFDNGTTATLIPLFGVEFGGLPLQLKPSRDTRLPVLKFGPEDLLPTLQQVQELEAAQLWHIEDILFDSFPDIRARFKSDLRGPPSVRAIPLHKTEQYPLPAMHIDESSLEGTLQVVDTIITKTLKLTGDGLEKHGIIMCAGDQLSISLLDKASASRRDDSDLLDNIGRYTQGQLGLFHVKIAADRMVANEYWGKPNSKSPWSLWKINCLLGRKAIAAGWKAKTLPPFRPTWELILKMTLPAHILDAFRQYCPEKKLEDWIAGVRDLQAIHEVAKTVQMELCSARRVSRLRRLPPAERDVPLENIILFNHDALILRELSHAVKRGDIGSVINILHYWMLMFRGTGKMPKYADALFHVLIELKQMDPKLRDAFTFNWLANLTRKVNGFKEMDLLQEHQNFWAKIIYCAGGSNCSWSWLSMVTVSIFTLRDVIRRMQVQYKMPHNGNSHTSPSAEKDIRDIRTYLEDQALQSYDPKRENNEWADVSRDLMESGAIYANTARAFRNFKCNTQKVTNNGVPEGVPVTAALADLDVDVGVDHDLGGEIDLDLGDLAMDEEEFPPGTDVNDFIATANDFIDELSRYEWYVFHLHVKLEA